MTDHEAIKIISRMILDMEYPNGKYHDDFTKEEGLKHLALYRAKSALQEREKRSKGCEFCDGTERSMMFRKGECAAMNDEVYVSGDAIIIDYGCKAYDTVKIGFCPMCGRPLKGEDNGKVD